MSHQAVSVSTIAFRNGSLLFLGLYGAIGELSLLLSGADLLILLVGIAVLLFASRPTKFISPHPYVLLVTVLAIALHVYEQFGKSSGGPSLGWLLWAMTPYALCLVVSSFPRTRAAAVAGSVVALAFDSLLHYDVFVNPTGSTARSP